MVEIWSGTANITQEKTTPTSSVEANCWIGKGTYHTSLECTCGMPGCVKVPLTKGDIQDNCRTKICTMYTINNILEGTVGINCMVDTITTAIIIAKD